MSATAPGNGTNWRLDDLNHRVRQLERGETGPAPVIYERMNSMRAELRAVKWILGIFAVAFVSGTVTLVISVLTGQFQ